MIKKIETVWVTGQFQALAPWEPGQEAEFYSISFLARIVHQWYSLSLLFPRIPAVTPLICRRTAGRQVSENCLATYCSVATSPGALPLPPPSPGSQQPAGLPRSWHHPDPEGRPVAEVASHVSHLQPRVFMFPACGIIFIQILQGCFMLRIWYSLKCNSIRHESPS